MDRLNKILDIRNKLQSGMYSIGTWIQIPHASIAEILGKSGYDWVTVDLEHGSISVDQLPDLFRAIELGHTLPLARISQANSQNCKQALEAGAGGVIVPMIENASQLESIKDACCWPPTGNRGVGFSRANLFGKYFLEYTKEAQAPILIAQIEHINAVNNLEEILKVKGLDGVMIGPYDLSASMGITANFEHKEFVIVMNRILELCKQFNSPCGDHVVYPDPEILQNRIEKGFQFIAYSTDAVFLNSGAKFPINI